MNLALNSPAVIQSNAVTEIARASAGSASSRPKAARETANEPSIIAVASPPDTDLDRRRPTLALARNPTNGSRGISSSMRSTTGAS